MRIAKEKIPLKSLYLFQWFWFHSRIFEVLSFNRNLVSGVLHGVSCRSIEHGEIVILSPLTKVELVTFKKIG